VIFQSLYRSAVIAALEESRFPLSPCRIKELVSIVECVMVQQFDTLELMNFHSWKLRKEQLRILSGELSPVRSNLICLFCLTRSAQHHLECGHTMCDHCAQLYGSPASDVEYRFTISACPCCLYQKPLVIDVLPPTANPTILAIDGGGVRGVIPLEFLILVQESLSPYCQLQDLVDLAIGTSSG
jgi:hypothetical protein